MICIDVLRNLKENLKIFLIDCNYFRIYKDENNIIIPHQLVKGGDTKFEKRSSSINIS